MSGMNKSVGALTVALAVVGGITLAGSAALGAVSGMSSDVTSRTVDLSQALAAPVASDLKVDVSGAELSIEYYSGDEVQFEASGKRADRWRVSVDDRTIRVSGPGRGFDWFADGWFDGWSGGDWFDADLPFGWGDDDADARMSSRATLRLPAMLQGIDADLTLDAGRLTVDGTLGEVDATVNAGALELDGSAEQFAVTVNAGRADVDLDGVSMGTYMISAGRVTSELSGGLSALTVEVSAGALDLTLPDDAYDLRRNMTAGSINSDLAEASDSAHRIDVRVTAGTVTLRPDRGDD